MSTLGKVFIVLTTIAMMAWAVLLAGVAEYNRNWGAKDDQQRRQIEGVAAGKDDEGKPIAAVPSLADQLEAARDEVAAVKEQFDFTLRENAARLNSRRNLVADRQKENSQLIESLERYKIDLAAAEATVEQAKLSLEQRNKEYNDLEKTKNDTEAEVARAKVEHDRLLARLEELRKDFAKTLAENQRLLKQVAEAKSKSAGPVDRRVRQTADSR